MFLLPAHIHRNSLDHIFEVDLFAESVLLFYSGAAQPVRICAIATTAQRRIFIEAVRWNFRCFELSLEECKKIPIHLLENAAIVARGQMKWSWC